jgi:toxin ParE1/3/4
MRLVIMPLAEQDIEVIGDYIARDDPARAVSFVGELREQCMRIADNPLGYRERPELAPGLRSCAHGNYVIFFDASPDVVEVVRVLHGARDLPTVLSEDQ